MKDHSQKGEQAIILNYFGDTKGIFIDIGANDGYTFSNTHALSLLGWHGVVVEPTDRAFKALMELYNGNKNVQAIQVCVGATTGMVKFWEPEDTLVSTTIKSGIHKWEANMGMKFNEAEKEMVTYEGLMGLTELKKFDFINIDTEGVDFDILKQIDLADVKMVCIEVNQEHRGKYIEHFAANDMKLVKDTNINLIFAK